MPKTTKKTITKVENSSLCEEISQKSKVGRKSQYETKIKPHLAEIERYIRCGVTEAQIYNYYKVSKTQWIQYKRNNSALSELLYNAKNFFKVELINKAYEIAVGGEYVETTEVEYYDIKDGEKVVTGGKTTISKRYNKPDAGMLQFLLINRFPEDFARDPQTIALRQQAMELAKKSKTADDDWEGI